jgi:tetratricopeptide (TPR) repeat protein
MKRIAIVGACLAVFFVLGAGPSAEQSQDSRALKWLEIGIREKNLSKKIEAYNKAIELDPVFVEALFNLGVAYKEQQNYKKAGEFLSRAYSAKPEKLSADLKLAILYELATTHNRLGQLTRYEETLRQAKKVATDEKMAATIAFELGRFLYQQDRFDESISELQEGRGLYPSRREDFANLIQLADNALERKRLYATADQAQAGGELERARTLLVQIRTRYPGDQKAATRIAELDLRLQKETPKPGDTPLVEQARQKASEGNLAEAVALYENVLQQSPNGQSVMEGQQEARKPQDQKQDARALESDYAAGLAGIESHDWAKAIISFEKVLADGRNFLDARERLKEAKRGLEREGEESAAAQHYAEGAAAMSERNWGRALVALEKVRSIKPDYRNTAGLLSEVEKALAQQAQGAAAPAMTAANVDSLYHEALAFEAKADWMQAVVALEKVQLVQPNYRDVAQRLAHAREKFNDLKISEIISRAKSDSQSNSLLYSGAIASVIGLPILAFLVFSQNARARFHCWRSDFEPAARIYEHMLTRHPDRVALLPKLADLYMRLGRRDENAMKIYRTIAQLNLGTPHREAINSLVAQHYLSEGRTDTDAIEVLEKALQDQRRVSPSARAK